jgi:hypothetical protein
MVAYINTQAIDFIRHKRIRRHAIDHPPCGLPGQFRTDQRASLTAFIWRAAKLAAFSHLNYRTARMFPWFY